MGFVPGRRLDAEADSWHRNTVKTSACTGFLCLYLTACAQVLGLDSYREGNGGAGSSATGNSSSGSSPQCSPLEQQPCYGGPAGTQDVGPCRAGTQVCDQSSQWGECVGQVVPVVEDCQTWADQDCSGNCGELVSYRVYGGGGLDALQFLHTIDNGDVLLMALVDSTKAQKVDYGGGPLDNGLAPATTLARLGPNGEHRWSRILPFQANYGVTLSSGTYVFGKMIASAPVAGVALSTGDSVLVRVETQTGAPLGAVKLASEPRRLTSFASDAALLFVTGGNYVLQSYKPDLTMGSSRIIGPTSQINIYGAFSDNGTWLFGSFTGTLALGGSSLATVGTDGLILRVGSNGPDLAAQLGVTGTAEIDAVQSAAADLILTGKFSGSLPNPENPQAPILSAGGSDLFLQRRIVSGAGATPVWSRSYPAGQNPVVTSLAFEPSGELWLGVIGDGDFGGGVLSGPSVLAGYTPTGNHLWSRSIDAALLGCAPLPDGRLLAGFEYVPPQGLNFMGAGKDLPQDQADNTLVTLLSTIRP